MSTISGLNLADCGVAAAPGRFTRPATRQSKLAESDPLDPFLDDGFCRIVQQNSGGDIVDAA
ncbi:hypothetical protein FRC10_002157, partial [Ceratobasidium sp. 414]